MDFQDDNPMLPIQFMEMIGVYTSDYSRSYEFDVQILVATGQSFRVASIQSPNFQHHFSKE